MAKARLENFWVLRMKNRRRLALIVKIYHIWRRDVHGPKSGSILAKELCELDEKKKISEKVNVLCKSRDGETAGGAFFPQGDSSNKVIWGLGSYG